MITLGSNEHLTTPIAPIVSCKVIGVGGAGLRLLDVLAQKNDAFAEFVAIHTDAQALLQSSASRKLQIGRGVVRGLGAGGDPATGEAAAHEQLDEIRAECEDAQIVIICAGLGGGTGSGTVPIIAREAAKDGAVVLAVVTLPFAGEGVKRREQAEAALSQLGKECAAVICFENDRMGDVAAANAPLVESLQTATVILADAVHAILRLLSLPSLFHVGLDEILPLFRSTEARCQFGYGSGHGADRASTAVKQALQSPLLNEGKVLTESGNVLLHISGDHSLRFEEMQKILNEVSRHVGRASQVFLGVATDPRATDEVGVTIWASASAKAVAEGETDSEEMADESHEASSEGAAKSAKDTANRKGTRTSSSRPEQDELPLDDAHRGRFKDLDPTMVEGQDLDIPTYIRMRLPLK